MTQREIPVFCELKQPELAPLALVRLCKSLTDAINLSIQLSRLSDSTICDRIGFDKGNFSPLRKGQIGIKEDLLNDLMRVTGNKAPIQYLLLQNPDVINSMFTEVFGGDRCAQTV